MSQAIMGFDLTLLPVIVTTATLPLAVGCHQMPLPSQNPITPIPFRLLNSVATGSRT